MSRVFTREELAALTTAGELAFVVGRDVFVLGPEFEHPGGNQVLEALAGEDVRAFFPQFPVSQEGSVRGPEPTPSRAGGSLRGDATAAPGELHVHSREAWKALLRARVGVLADSPGAGVKGDWSSEGRQEAKGANSSAGGLVHLSARAGGSPGSSPARAPTPGPAPAAASASPRSTPTAAPARPAGPPTRASASSAASASRAPTTDEYGVDLSAPILAQVSALGPSYWAWAHEPVAGAPRFFANPALEAVTKVRWWVVPTVWLPYAAWLLARAAGATPRPGGSLAGTLALGCVLWWCIEYSLHRFAFHLRPSGGPGLAARAHRYVHFLFHGCHHKFPQDGERLVFPPVPAAALASLIRAAIGLALPPADASIAFCGAVLAYVAYDVAHYLTHSGTLPGPWARRHLAHHFRDETSGFGISHPGLDLLLGTLAESSDSSRAVTRVRPAAARGVVGAATPSA